MGESDCGMGMAGDGDYGFEVTTLEAVTARPMPTTLNREATPQTLQLHALLQRSRHLSSTSFTTPTMAKSRLSHFTRRGLVSD